MSEDQPKPQDAIARARVEKLAENLKSSAENVLDLISAEEIQVESLLEATRFMARTARRIGRRANWPVGEPPPGNRRDDSERAPKRKSPPKAGGDRKGPRTGAPPRRGGPRSSGGAGGGNGGGARRTGGPRRG